MQTPKEVAEPLCRIKTDDFMFVSEHWTMLSFVFCFCFFKLPFKIQSGDFMFVSEHSTTLKPVFFKKLPFKNFHLLVD